MAQVGSRPFGGAGGGRLVDPVAKGVGVVPQKGAALWHDDHVDHVESDLNVAFWLVFGVNLNLTRKQERVRFRFTRPGP